MTVNDKAKKAAPKETPRPKCGLVVPISTLDDCSEQHWLDVKAILTEAIESAGFKANLVSDADDVGIIQKRIIQNLYDNPIVVCDVSGKNPNVMFELGLRLAFDKPTIIVKDDATAYSFDTAPIEHLEYPRDLRFNKIVAFKSALREKIEGTHKKATTDSSYTTFLKHFGQFHVAQLETTEVSKEDFIIEELRDLRRMVAKRFERDRDELHRARIRHRRSLSVDDISAMRDAVENAVRHLSSEGRMVVLPDKAEEVAEYILHNSNLTRRFDSRSEFQECFDMVIHS